MQIDFETLITEHPVPPYYVTMLDMRATTFAREAQALHRMVIEPMCSELQHKLDVLPRSTDHESLDAWESMRNIQMEAHRTFALGLGALWERGFRENLRNAAYVLCKPVNAKLMSKVNGSGWDGLAAAFEEIRGFPLTWFPMSGELSLLQKLSSAIRHGDGASAEAVQKAEPALFREYEVETGPYAYFAYGGYGDAAVRKLDIPLGSVCIHRNQIMAQARWTKPMKAVRVFSQRRAILRKRLSLLKKHST